MKKIIKKGFTLVELLAVIVILAIILVIAVPQIMNTIKDTTKASFESSAKMVAAQVENQYTVAKTLNKEFNTTGNCMQDWAGLNSTDYASCEYEITSDGTAKVTLVGKSKFKDLKVVDATRSSAIAIETDGDSDVVTAADFIEGLLADEARLNNGLQETIIDPSITTAITESYNAGIRYIGSMDEVKNKVYYNCEDTDSAGVAYGAENYDYANNCEIWRIIGVFDTKSTDSETEDAVPRIKIINTNSTFEAAWDYSVSDDYGIYTAINQWGPSKYQDGSDYEGADLMRLLNGYYIGASNSECEYNIKDTAETCTTESLTEANMKPLTNTALNMIDDGALWYTYGVGGVPYTKPENAVYAYLQERGITKKYTGCNENESPTNECEEDNVIRNNKWTGLVGLASMSDMSYSGNWLADYSEYPWAITPYVDSSGSACVWKSCPGYAGGFSIYPLPVWPTVYLNADVQIIGGDGNEIPFKLS